MLVNPDPIITWELREAKDIKVGDVVRYRGDIWKPVEDRRALLSESNPHYIELDFATNDPDTLQGKLFKPERKIAVRIEPDVI